MFDSLRNFQSTADNALSDVDTFINNTLDVCESVTVVSSVGGWVGGLDG